ncbi:hypothetical protein AUEXF2481DRAFT_610926 [Aureobasidium subglaciale EXF-2481]|uniref:Uncharacterized protein n=1 Tax=Aureobasidium subglaciale (strain EXF-2481) TaxID=1043005 RepID=A0A074YGA4_AURSE|nr:uncharacterized protein AUEXF2481DRAFT_610926 [Aureobasidium subglaciale EXF-2481]KEQ96750.1 hypothetical protein AUEXF2481DRAFT_610926 [Aureobasidium subglaciale EXF-2481]
MRRPAYRRLVLTGLSRRVGTSMQMTNAILIRVLVGKIEDRERLLSILCRVEVVQKDPNWNCVVWVMQAWRNLQDDGLATGIAVLEWKTVRDAAMAFCQRKHDEHRFDIGGQFPISGVPPTYGLLTSKLLSP